MLPIRKKKVYTQLPWSNFYDSKEFLETTRGRFCVYTKGKQGSIPET